MDNVKHLIEVLKSQVVLYSELAELMAQEKESVIAWAINETVEITKKKEVMLRRERVQEEARTALLAKLAVEMGADSVVISDVIKYAKDPEQKAALIDLGEQLMELVTKIHAENLSLRMLYNTNNKLINDFFTTIGRDEGSSYGPNGVSKKVSTFRSIIS